MTCKVNEKRVFSSKAVQDKLEELGVQKIKVDMTDRDQVYFKDLARVQRYQIPVNLVYPADYPNSPAILLEELISPGQALQALDRVSGAKKSPSETASRESERTVAEK